MNNGPQDYYNVLGVADTATQQEISRAFRGLMRTRHPDVDASAAVPTSAEVLAIMHAFGVLRDPKKRAEYDRRQNENRNNDNNRSGEQGRSWGQGHDGDQSVRGERPMRASGQEIPVRYGPRESPVRRAPRPSPLLRVTPVRWEQGPFAGPDGKTSRRST
jgi:DnaJ-class molecular chaperone